MKIDVKTAQGKIQAQSVALLDVRTPAEFQSSWIKGAENISIDTLDRHLSGLPKDKEILLICQSGPRDQKAYDLLSKNGFQELSILDGGMNAWESAGAACEKGKAVMSLERQVRIAAGALVAIGTGLGFFVHSGFFGIPAFVGCGLVFAGLTDTCAMGMMIAKMPWNQKGASCCSTNGKSAV